MERLLPSPAVGPAHPAARKSGWARMVPGYSPCRGGAKGRALGHGNNLRRGDIQAISLAPRRDLLAILPPWSKYQFALRTLSSKRVELAKGQMKALCTVSFVYDGFPFEYKYIILGGHVDRGM